MNSLFGAFLENEIKNIKAIIDIFPFDTFAVNRNGEILLSNELAKKQYCQDEKYKEGSIGDRLNCINATGEPKGCGNSKFCELCLVKKAIEHSFDKGFDVAKFNATISTRSAGIRTFNLTVSFIDVDYLNGLENDIVIVTIHDITENEKKERLSTAFEIISLVFNEMNQPLQVIMGNAEILSQYQLEKRVRSKIDNICSEMEKVKKLTAKVVEITDLAIRPSTP